MRTNLEQTMRTPPTASLASIVAMSLVAAVFVCVSPLVLRSQSREDTGSSIASQQPEPKDVFWSRLQTLCGHAFGGRVTEGSPADSVMRRSALVMHVRSCTPMEIRIPFHVGSDRSRTWVITRTATGFRLKHDHRHADGTEDAITQYGGDTRDSGSFGKQEFYADAHTASLIPAARTNVWTMEIEPGQRFAYALRREGTDRRFRVEFNLVKHLASPPPPWGARP